MNITLILILTLFASLVSLSSAIVCYDCATSRDITCRLDYLAPDSRYSRYECTSKCNRTIDCTTNRNCQLILTKIPEEDYYKTLHQTCQITEHLMNMQTCASLKTIHFPNSTYIHQLFTQYYSNTSLFDRLPPMIENYPASFCACNTSYCNEKIIFSFTHDAISNGMITNNTTPITTTTPVNTSTNSTPFSHISHIPSEYLALIAAGCLLALILASLIMCPVILYRSYRKKTKFSTYRLAEAKMDSRPHEMATLSSPEGFYEDPELSRVPILTDLKLEDLIGSGKYGHVWRCVYEGREMACKVWLPCEINAWRSERAIFSQETTYHPNIVKYIYSGFIEERSDQAFIRKGVLLMELCARGSLSNFLETSTLSWEVASRFAFEIASGISYLHSHTGLTRAEKGYAQVRKVPIAHRDIKSSNVLIRSNLTCCISDLGLAIALNPTHSKASFVNAGQVGTPFYMAPEGLAARINLEDLDSFKQMDVFSLGLVLWEIFSRCEVEGTPPLFGEHKIPFSDVNRSLLQSSRVSRVELIQELQEMHEEYPIEQLLHIPPHWREHPLFSKARRTILDCTYKEPEARISAGTVSGRFEKNMVKNKQNDQEVSLSESFDFGSFASMSSLMRMIENQRLSRITCDNYSQLPEYSV